MGQTTDSKASEAGGLEDRIRQEVDRLTYLPGSVAVAIKFVDLGKDLDADPADYERTIASDAALGTKILALANSAWFGVRSEVTKILQAVTLLGLSSIRTLAISYCMAGLHNRLKIPPEDAKRYWQASLCKGVAAKTFAASVAPTMEDEAFLAGLFQDLAIPVIHSVAGEAVLAILRNPNVDAAAQIGEERIAFGVDHCEAGRWLATKLELPEAYIDAIGFHHDPDCIARFIQPDVLAEAIKVASLFPHVPEQWRKADIEALGALLPETSSAKFRDREAFLETVQKEFETLYGFFEPGQQPELRLADLVTGACEEIADSTTRMVGQVRDLMNDAARTGELVHHLVTDHQRLIDETRLDALTGALNRSGFLAEGTKAVEAAGRYAAPFAVLYCDVDGFKETNDKYGHHFGDFVLRGLSGRIRGCVRKTDLVGRLGGDEFALVLTDVPANRALMIVDAIMRGIREEPFVKGKVAVTRTLSVGVLCVPGSRCVYDFEALLSQADALMYRAKRSGPGQLRMGSWKSSPATEPA